MWYVLITHYPFSFDRFQDLDDLVLRAIACKVDGPPQERSLPYGTGVSPFYLTIMLIYTVI